MDLCLLVWAIITAAIIHFDTDIASNLAGAALSGCLLGTFDKSSYSSEHSAFWCRKQVQVHLAVSLAQLWNQTFLQRALVPFGGER